MVEAPSVGRAQDIIKGRRNRKTLEQIPRADCYRANQRLALKDRRAQEPMGDASESPEASQ